MRYFFLAYAVIALLVVGIFGVRGQKSTSPPIMIFPDMDNQDKVKAQVPSTFFADGMGSRMPVAGTQPLGFNPDGESVIGGIPEHEFGGLDIYYHTGQIGDYYGTGMPEELALDAESAAALIRRGRERYSIYCAVCHGASGDGQGIAGQYGVPGIANLQLGPFQSETYPDGRLYDVITHGKGQMSGYGYNIPLRDRWAIVAYVRAIQEAKNSSAQ